MKVPKLGNIWINGELVMFRNFTNGNPENIAGKENWSLVDDVICPSSPLVEDGDTGLVVYNEDIVEDEVTNGDLV